MPDIKWTVGATWFTGEDNDEENVSEEKVGTLEEVIEWMKAFEQSREREQARAEAVIPEDEEETELD